MMFETRINRIKLWFRRQFMKDSFAMPAQIDKEFLENGERGPDEDGHTKKQKKGKNKERYEDDSYMQDEGDNSRYPIESDEDQGGDKRAYQKK